ncbi:tripartite tricarboxylate transporter TctB family protein [Falsiroseomonas sp. HW251]|uniref:tripartite tricarboxylate transporter TctB family protein n=1 Tax=Falsiroseomonas sp. HW251 TaxID=3390998 RepID=UPI003D3107ED
MTGRETQDAPRAPEGLTATAEAFVAERRDVAGVSTRTMEIATSLAFAMVGAAAIRDSARIGAGWGTDGPQSGYFPFWIGLFLVVASAVNLAAVARRAAPRDAEGGMFLTTVQARTVATVFIPTVIYVAAIPFTGIYAASAVLVAWFMARMGGFRLTRAIPAGIATAVVTFVVFEIWFLVALPKGPIEEWLGF